MMMPANFSAIAETEMTYVVGGGLIADITAPVWNKDNVKQFNTNIVTIIGNTYLSRVIDATLGTIFSGEYLVNKGTKEDKNYVTIFGKDKALWEALDPTENGTTNFFNKCLQGIGALAAVYNLGTTTVKNAANDTLVF